MEYKIKEAPERVFRMETYQFILLDENNNETEIRYSISSKNEEFLMWTDGGWDEIKDDEMLSFLYENYFDEQDRFNELETEKIHEKMNLVAEEFVKNNSQFEGIKLLDELIGEAMKETDYNKTYQDRFYDAYKFARKYLKK
jgi:hypothetical protein